MEKFLSIVIPVYNTKLNLLRSALESCEQFTNSEVILYNDGSDKVKYDKLVNEFKSKLDIKFIESEKNEGILKARLSSVKYVTGRYLTFLDSDDEFLPESSNIIYSIINSKGNYQMYSFDRRNYINYDEFVKSEEFDPRLTGRVFHTKFIKSVLDRITESGLINLGDDSIISLFMYKMHDSESSKFYESDEKIYKIKVSHTSNLYKEDSPLVTLRKEYGKLVNLRRYLSKIIFSCGLFLWYDVYYLTRLSLRLSTDRFILCKNFYKLIPDIVDDYGWDIVIDYFTSRELTIEVIKEYFNKLEFSNGVSMI